MENQKNFQFEGKAGGYFLATLVALITAYIPIFGWPIGFNYSTGYIVNNMRVGGRKLKYNAGYGETLVFLLVNILLVIITIGIYTFWFGPKIYRFITDHTTYDEEVAATTAATTAPAVPVTPVVVDDVTPATTNQTPPTGPVVS